MKKKIVYITIMVVAVLFQTSVLPVLARSGQAADNVLMLVLAWSVLDGFAGFLGWSLFAGVLYDLATYSVVGVHALIFLAVVYLVSFFSRRFSVEVRGTGIILLAVFVVAATLLSHGILALAFAWEAGTLTGYWKAFGSLGSLIWQVLYNLIVFAVWFNVIKKVKNFFALGA